MIVEFVFENFRSFKHEHRFSMVASSVREHEESLFGFGKMRLLPAAVIYGANSSGKSNALKAMMRMKAMIRKSVQLNPSDTLPFEPFLLDQESTSKPTSFELTFVLDDTRYRYGFEYNLDTIVSEWLLEKKSNQREYSLFVRAGDEFEISSSLFQEGIGKEQSTASNRLFLSLVAQLNGTKAQKIMSWFSSFNVLSGLSTEDYENYTLEKLHHHDEQNDTLQVFYRKLQLGFKEITVEEKEIDESVLQNLPEEFRGVLSELKDKTFVEVNTHHNVYDDRGNIIGETVFNKDRKESEGTKKIIELSGPIFDTLNNGKTLVIDELDAKLHPFLTRSILQLFMDPQTNPNKAQLIFATHDTHLLDLAYLRRDQIWFTEKDETEASDLYSLVEFKDKEGKKVRNDSSWEKNYINGRYGAVPFLN